MVQLNKLKQAFKTCRGPYPWRDFEAMITGMGYLRHEPHDGEMGTSFVKAMRENLEEQGLL